MPRMSDFEEFLNGSMVSDGDILVLLNAGVFREPEETGLQRTVFQIRVRLPDGRTKTWTMNKTTRNRLAKAYGDDSESWLNRRARLKILQQNVRGEIKDVIYGYAVEGKPTEQTPLAPANQLIRFVKAYEDYKVEDVANLDRKTADSLIMLNIAVPVETSKIEQPTSQPMQRVRFVKFYGAYKVGEEVDIPKTNADGLIENGTAVPVDIIPGEDLTPDDV